MKHNQLLLICFAFLATALTSCQAIGDIFKAGVWVGILLVAVVVFIIVWIVRKSTSK